MQLTTRFSPSFSVIGSKPSWSLRVRTVIKMEINFMPALGGPVDRRMIYATAWHELRGSVYRCSTGRVSLGVVTELYICRDPRVATVHPFSPFLPLFPLTHNPVDTTFNTNTIYHQFSETHSFDQWPSTRPSRASNRTSH